jgi:hypothetical protein
MLLHIRKHMGQASRKMGKIAIIFLPF